MTGATESAPASSVGRRVRAAALLSAIPATPVIVASLFGIDGATEPFMLGVLVGLVAALMSVKLAVVLSAVAGLTSAVGALLHPYPIAAGVLLGVLSAGAGYAARRGVHSPLLMVPLVTGFAVAEPAVVLADAGTTVNALVLGVVTTIAGLWMVAVWLVLGRRIPTVSPVPISARVAGPYAAVMGVVMGVATWAVLMWVPDHAGAWLLMTIIVVMQPDPGATLAVSVGRMLGTVVGILIAAVVSSFVDSATALIVIGVACYFVALVLRFDLKKPYWMYVALLTPAVVFFDSTTGDIGATEVDRLGATLVGGAVAVAVAFAARTLTVQELVPGPDAPRGS